uniref:Tumor necrosis factor, alpha-induced protein 6 n=1 Tax=Zonotrichia albicollis TaxID=44394 RepID=A0A8D2MKW5_ZONAL
MAGVGRDEFQRPFPSTPSCNSVILRVKLPPDQSSSSTDKKPAEHSWCPFSHQGQAEVARAGQQSSAWPCCSPWQAPRPGLTSAQLCTFCLCFHVCAAGWMAKGRVGYPIVKAGANCGFGKTGIVDYGIRLNRTIAYCCGGVFTDSKHVFKSPGYPNEYENNQVCYWHIRVRYGQRIHLQFLEFDVEDDIACQGDFLEVYDSYDDVNGFVGRFCGDELPDDIISTGNVMTLKFLTDGSVTAGGFQIRYSALDTPAPAKNASAQGKNTFQAGKFGIM